jgi:sodium/hydrogen antiporter
VQWSIIVAGLVTVGWTLFAAPLQHRYLRLPLVMTLAGIVTGLFTHSKLAEALDAGLTARAAEIILAILLFVDATEVRRGRLFGADTGVAARLLVLAMPLSFAIAVGLGLVLLPGLPWAALLVLACAVVPVDFAAAESLVRDSRVPARVRDALNVEGGYNDGIASPLFTYALLLAGADESFHGSTLWSAVRAVAIAIAVGLVVGWAHAWLLGRCESHGWATAQSARVSIVILPILTYAFAVAVTGNGFVSAFVCGIAFRSMRQRIAEAAPASVPEVETDDRALLEDVTTLLALVMWFVFGNVAVFVIDSGYLDWETFGYCALVLTVVRLVPVLLALVGSRPTGQERLLIALLGPRGTTSIVFALLAYNELAEPRLEYTVLSVTTLVVLGSVLLHGLAAMPAVHFVQRRREQRVLPVIHRQARRQAESEAQV